MDTLHFAGQYLTRLKGVIDSLDLDCFGRIAAEFLSAYQRQARIFVMGNGGSGATASHLACDINKGCCLDLDQKFKMICLNDNMPTMLALANDLSYEAVFVEQLKNFFVPGDLVLGISGSGNSSNVLGAIAYAGLHGGRTMGWCGFDGGELARRVDVAFIVPSNDMQQVEDMHVVLAHMVMQTIFTTLHGGTCA